MLARAEAAFLGEMHRVGEAARDGVGFVRVAAEGDGRTALLVPPRHNRRVQRNPRVDLERTPRVGGQPQHVTELLFEVCGIELSRPGRPAANGVVNVGEHLERLVGRHQHRDLGQVAAHDLGGSAMREELAWFLEAIPRGEAVHRAEDTVEVAPTQNPCHLRGCRCGSPTSSPLRIDRSGNRSRQCAIALR